MGTKRLPSSRLIFMLDVEDCQYHQEYDVANYEGNQCRREHCEFKVQMNEGKGGRVWNIEWEICVEYTVRITHTLTNFIIV